MMENFPPQLAWEAMRGCPVGVLLIDPAGKVTWINETLSMALGSSADVLGKERQSLADSEQGGLISDARTVLVRDGQGYERWLEHSAQALSDGGEIHFFVDCTKVIELQREAEKLKQEVSLLTLSDDATGLLSQRAVMLVLEPQVSRCRRYDTSLAIVTLGVTFNRDSGARELSRLLKDQLRWADLIGRDPQGNFLILLPETDHDAAAALTDKLGKALGDAPYVDAWEFGIAEWRKGDSAATLLKRAADALQTASALTEA